MLIFDDFNPAGVSYAVARPCGIFGDSASESILMNNAAWVLKRSPLFLLAGDGMQRFQPIHVSTLGKFYVAAFGDDIMNGVFHVWWGVRSWILNTVPCTTLAFFGWMVLGPGASGSWPKMRWHCSQCIFWCMQMYTCTCCAIQLITIDVSWYHIMIHNAT